MHFPDEEQKQALLEQALQLASKNTGPAEVAEIREFIGLYYRQVDAEDLASRAPADVLGAAMAHRRFAQRFSSGTPKLRVYNPRADEQGWSSSHTVIEIVNDDMPFLVDSVTMEVNRQGYTIHLFNHPIYATRRDEEGELLAVTAPGKEGRHESWIHVEVDRDVDMARLKALGDGLLAVLADVRAAVQDWRAMRDRMDTIVKELAAPPAVLDAANTAEIRAFLAWVAENHFTFIGYRDYDLVATNGEDQLRIVPRSGLGVLREPMHGGISQGFTKLPPELRALAREPRLLVLTKANTRATVHRPGYLDYIGVKRFDASSKVVGERRFVGLYTSSAYHADPREIPLLRRKVAHVVERAGFRPDGHMHKNLISALQSYPRDELFQVDEDTLLETMLGILRLGDRRKTRVFIRRDLYGRFYSCLVYLPRENFNTDVRQRIEAILKRHLAGQSVEFTVHLSEAVLARIHMLVRTDPMVAPKFDVHEIEAEIVQATRRWEEDLRNVLIDTLGEATAIPIARKYAGVFPVGYRDTVPAAEAVRDIEFIERLDLDHPFSVRLYRPQGGDVKTLRLRVLRLAQAVPLSASLPVLENMGLEVLDEVSHEI